MPLDMGAVTDDSLHAAVLEVSAIDDSEASVDLQGGEHIGAPLRLARERKGLSLVDVAERTYVRRAYLEAIDQMRLEALPSRPFVIGYIRAYADAVGLDPDAAVARFKQDNPERDAVLREPLGVEKKRDGRLRLIILVGVVIAAAILIFNLVQRALTTQVKAPSAVPETAASAAPAASISGEAPVALGAPTPPPQESTRPDPYLTPGLPGPGGGPSMLAAGQKPTGPSRRPAFPPACRSPSCPAAASTALPPTPPCSPCRRAAPPP